MNQIDIPKLLRQEADNTDNNYNKQLFENAAKLIESLLEYTRQLLLENRKISEN